MTAATFNLPVFNPWTSTEDWTQKGRQGLVKLTALLAQATLFLWSKSSLWENSEMFLCSLNVNLRHPFLITSDSSCCNFILWRTLISSFFFNFQLLSVLVFSTFSSGCHDCHPPGLDQLNSSVLQPTTLQQSREERIGQRNQSIKNSFGFLNIVILLHDRRRNGQKDLWQCFSFFFNSRPGVVIIRTAHE